MRFRVVADHDRCQANWVFDGQSEFDCDTLAALALVCTLLNGAGIPYRVSRA